MRNKNEKGFTLIELLVVIAIIGLLASVVLLALNSARAKSRDAKRVADVRQFASALELMYNDVNSYPTCGAVDCSTICGGAIACTYEFGGNTGEIRTSGTLGKKFTPNYIGLVPLAPTPYDNASGNTCTPSNNKYNYAAAYSGINYTLTFCLGDNTGGYGPGLHTLTPAGIQ